MYLDYNNSSKTIIVMIINRDSDENSGSSSDNDSDSNGDGDGKVVGNTLTSVLMQSYCKKLKRRCSIRKFSVFTD